MKILVTGGAGFIGSHLVDAVVARGDQVCVLDNFSDFYDPKIKRANLAASRAAIDLQEADLEDRDAIQRVVTQFSPEVIVHLAARAGVRPSVEAPEAYVKTNVLGTLHLLDAARAAATKRLIFASSSSIYGASTEVPFRESSTPCKTLSPYAATKLAGEHLCSNYSHLYGLQVVCLRFFTVYGPRQRPDLSIHKFTHRIFHEKPIEIYGDGTAQRDFTHISDILQGVLSAMTFAGSPFEIFNLGENQTVELRAAVRLIEESLGRKADIRYQPPIPGDMPRSYADISKSRRLLNYRPSISITEGIPQFVDWYRSGQN